jgi:HSP20 family protein
MNILMHISILYSADKSGDGYIELREPKSITKHPSRPHNWHPPTDLYETEDSYLVRIEIAGMNTEEFVISLADQRLEVSGIRPDLPMPRGYHQMEIPYGNFRTVIQLPTPVEVEQVLAEYEDGFLIITMPRVKPIHIKIKEE